MVRRNEVEDEELPADAARASTEDVDDRAVQAAAQTDFLRHLATRLDLDVLASDAMWR